MGDHWKQVKRQGELAGFTRSNAETKAWDRLFAPDPRSLQIPLGLELTEFLGEPAIAWEAYSGPDGGGKFADPAGIMTAFAALEDASPEKVLAFAKKYGVLDVCEAHHLPSHHETPRFSFKEWTHCPLLNPEPVSVWHGWAKKVVSCIAVAASLHRSQFPKAEDYQVFFQLGRGNDPQEFGLGISIEEDRRDLAGEIWLILSMCDVGVIYTWDPPDPRPNIRLGGGGVLGAVFREVAFTVARTEGLAVCSNCGRGFIPPRKPRRDQRVWCTRPECQRARKAYAQRRWREKRKKSGTD